MPESTSEHLEDLTRDQWEALADVWWAKVLEHLQRRYPDQVLAVRVRNPEHGR